LEEEKLKAEKEKKTEEEEKKLQDQIDEINNHEASKSTKKIEEESKPQNAFLLPKQSSDVVKEVPKEARNRSFIELLHLFTKNFFFRLCCRALITQNLKENLTLLKEQSFRHLTILGFLLPSCKQPQ
jgi:hypothetical protein